MVELENDVEQNGGEDKAEVALMGFLTGGHK